ncbi:hypothetical protein ACSBR2_002661 [Camellia fascicularis]
MRWFERHIKIDSESSEADCLEKSCKSTLYDDITAKPKGQSSKTPQGESSTMKEALLSNTENTFLPTPLIEKTILIIEKHDEQWMRKQWEIKRRYLTTQVFPSHFDQYRYVYEQILIDTTSVEFTYTLVELHRTIALFDLVWLSSEISCLFLLGGYILILPDNSVLKPENKNSVIGIILMLFLKHFIIRIQLTIILDFSKSTKIEWQVPYSHNPGNREITMSKTWVVFVINFGIPWIWKWDFQCDYLQTNIPRLKRVLYAK